MLRREAEEERAAWLRVLRGVCEKLDPRPGRLSESDHPVVKILGSIAWGRFEKEGGPDETKDNVVEGLGYLQGVRTTAMRAARVLRDEKADKLLRDVPHKVRLIMSGQRERKR